MLIGIDASRANRDEKTGVEWYAYHVIQNLKKIMPQDMEVVLYSQEKLKGDLADLPANWRSRVLNWPPWIFWTQMRLSWEMLRHRPDVLFIPAHVIPLIHPKKTVMTIHDVVFKYFPESYSWRENWYQEFAVKFAKKHAVKIITPSEATKRDLIALYDFPPEKIRAVLNGYDENLYQKISDENKINAVLKKYGIKKPFLLSIGRQERKKNTAGIIEAFSHITEHISHSTNQNLSLVLVGKKGFGYEEVEEAIKNSPAKDRIKQLGWVAPEELVCFLSAAAVFVFPSFYEGFGIPVIEAMACGCPVVTSGTSSLPEAVGEAALLVDPRNIDEIAGAVEKILTDENLRPELIKKGFEQAKKFSWRKTGEGVLAVITSNLGTKLD